MSPISNLLYNYPKLSTYKSTCYDSTYTKLKNRQNSGMIIEIGNINQPLGSNMGMTGTEHKRTSGGEESVLYLDSVLVTYCIAKCICQYT